MNRTELKNRAKQALSGNWGTAIIVMIIFMLLSSLLSTTGIGSLAVGLLNVGYFACFLSIMRTKSASIEGCVSAITENIGTKFVSTLLVTVYTFLWSLLFVIPGIIKSYSYAMTPYILIDHPELSATDAIKESERMMNGHKMDLFILNLSFIGWILLSALTCGILILYVEPYMQAARAEFYRTLKGEDEKKAEEPFIEIPH